MSKNHCAITGLIASAFLLGGCTAEQAFYSTQHWQRTECRKVRNGDDRNKCEARPQLTFEQYEAERNRVVDRN